MGMIDLACLHVNVGCGRSNLALTGNLRHMAEFLWGRESKGRRRRRQVMKGREARTGAIHADGRDGGNEGMSKPNQVHGQCRAGFTRRQEVKGVDR